VLLRKSSDMKILKRSCKKFKKIKYMI